MRPTLVTVIELAPTAPDVALLFEGGGMRAVHTAGVVETLIEAGIHTGLVAGISAGASHLANYVSRDAVRLMSDAKKRREYGEHSANKRSFITEAERERKRKRSEKKAANRDAKDAIAAEKQSNWQSFASRTKAGRIPGLARPSDASGPGQSSARSLTPRGPPQRHRYTEAAHAD